MVIMAMIFLGIIVTGLIRASRFSWGENDLERGRFIAKQLAESGAALATHPDVAPGDPVLRQDFGDGRKFEVKISSEGGRMLVTTLDDEVFVRTMRELFIRWGLDASQASIASDSIADWVDDNSEARTSGAESQFYASFERPQYPPNEAFTSLEQMLLVRGMDQVAKIQPNWREYFTLYGDGLIDVNAAPADLLEAFFGTTPDAAINLTATRAGNDTLDATEDDYRFEDEGEVQALMGLTEDEWNEVSEWVTLENTTRRIESTGSVGGKFAYRLIVLAEVTNAESGESTTVARITE